MGEQLQLRKRETSFFSFFSLLGVSESQKAGFGKSVSAGCAPRPRVALHSAAPPETI